MFQGNAIVGQSGGPTSVINSSLAGVIDSARQSDSINRLFGMRFGIEGVLQDVLLDLSSEDQTIVDGLRRTPSSALGSTRLKLQNEHFPKILEQLKRYDIRYFFMIGGNDTMDTIHRIVEYAANQGYDMRGVGISKTVDNDLFGTDHTPGFPSAARYVALSVLQAGLLSRDMQRVDQFCIFQTVGRSAGWLPASAACAKRTEADAPHIILLPERPFQRQPFLDLVQQTHEQHGFVSIVCGEGIVDSEGRPVSASTTTDKFENVEFGAMGGTSAAMMLHQMISDTFGWRGEFQICESLQMCAADRAVPLDFEEAYQCGKQAVRLATAGTSGVMVCIERINKSDQPYRANYATAPLEQVANHERPMPPEFIAENGMFVTDAFLKFCRPLVGELPEYTSLSI